MACRLRDSGTAGTHSQPQSVFSRCFSLPRVNVRSVPRMYHPPHWLTSIHTCVRTYTLTHSRARTQAHTCAQKGTARARLAGKSDTCSHRVSDSAIIQTLRAEGHPGVIYITPRDGPPRLAWPGPALRPARRADCIAESHFVWPNAPAYAGRCRNGVAESRPPGHDPAAPRQGISFPRTDMHVGAGATQAHLNLT